MHAVTTVITGWRRLIGSLISIIFRKIALYLVALLWKLICDLGDPMRLRHPVLLMHKKNIFCI